MKKSKAEAKTQWEKKFPPMKITNMAIKQLIDMLSNNKRFDNIFLKSGSALLLSKDLRCFLLYE